MTFSNPMWLLGLIPIAIILIGFRRHGHVGYSSTSLITRPSPVLRALTLLPLALMLTASTLLLLALSRPQVPGEPESRKVEGRDIMLAVDISVSMARPFEGELSPHKVPPGLEFKAPLNERRKDDRVFQFQPSDDGKLKRIDASQYALQQFIENRWSKQTGDRIGLILFDERPRYGWPLTDDLRMLYRKSQFITGGLGTGTNFGDHPPGPIDLAVAHLLERGEARSKAIIMITDGEDQIQGYTRMRIRDLLVQNDIRLYLVGIGETLAKRDVDIIGLAESVGGEVFRVEDAESLRHCFETIDELEKSAVSSSELETRDDIYHYFAWPALAVFLLLLVVEAMILVR